MSPPSDPAVLDPRNADLLVWVNGVLVPRAGAVVSVYDSGFLLGDGVWEGIRLVRGTWAFLDAHLDRLWAGARALDLDIGRTRDGLRDALDAVAAANGMTDAAHARLMVTRGVKVRAFQNPRLSIAGATIVIIVEHAALPADPPAVTLASVAHHRGLPLTQDPKLNTHSKLNCVLALIAAQKAGADEALMFDPFGFVNTTNSCNFFLVRDGALWTSTGDYCLGGITRAAVIEIAREAGIPVVERNFGLVETYGADEAFLTGTVGGLTPVATIDGRQVPGGPVTARLRALYRVRIGDL